MSRSATGGGAPCANAAVALAIAANAASTILVMATPAACAAAPPTDYRQVSKACDAKASWTVVQYRRHAVAPPGRVVCSRYCAATFSTSDSFQTLSKNSFFGP